MCGLAAVIVFSWLYIIIAILVRVKLGSPVLFPQERPGKDEKIFKLYKFRSMTDARDENGELLPDEVRLGEGKNRKSDVYDEHWNLLDVQLGYKCFPAESLPANKELLVELAEKVAKPFKFIRVDLYNIDGKIYFSELTFHPGGGLIPFNPREFDRELGKMLGL